MSGLDKLYERFVRETPGRTEIVQLQKALELALEKNAVPLKELRLNRENWNRLFPDGTVETPVATVKLGENQFEKLQKDDRKNLLGAMYETLTKPSVVLEKETLDEKSGGFRPVNVYGKSFVREESGHKRAVESVIIFKDGKNISIGTHNKELERFVRQIKTADQTTCADSEISRVTSLVLQNGGSHVQLKGVNTQALNSKYDENVLLSTDGAALSQSEEKPVKIEVNGVERTCKKGLKEGFVNAVKMVDELSDKNKRLAEENQNLRAENEELKSRLNVKNRGKKNLMER